jgi:arylsulfatase A-like enzyme
MRLLPALLFLSAGLSAAGSPPNVVLIMTDDQGWADISAQGKGVRTPNLDRLGAEGIRMTSFYATQAVCTSSRAALLTGCYPNRIGLGGNALGPNSPIGINPQEQTLAELLKARGYRTGISGKWHLGDKPAFLPPRHGFDESLILPYSNDMWPLGHDPRHPRPSYPLLRWIEAGVTGEVVGTWDDMDKVTARQFDWAEAFVRRHAGKNQPFFLYIAPSMPHTPLGRSAAHKGKGPTPYAEVISEIDERVGRLLELLRQTGADNNTLVIYTSDNGPWLNFGDHAGSAGPFREGKGTTWEGGVRVPFLARWPAVIKPGRVSPALAANLDILPTVVAATGAKSPELPIDGLSFLPLLRGESETARDAFTYYYAGDNPQAIRKGRWKLHLPHTSRSYEGIKPGVDGEGGPTRQKKIELSLYDLEKDPGERTDVSAQHPEVVEELKTLAAKSKQELLAGKRAPGRVK